MFGAAFYPSVAATGTAGGNEGKEVMSGGETLVIVAIVGIFAFFMGALAWADHHSRDSRGRWD